MDLAEFLVITYMNESHVQKPFLLTDYVANLVQEIYSHTPPEASDAQDLFRLYMICAISAVPLRRRGLEQQHPYSFFLAASAYFDKANFSSGVEALQNLFLLARFAVYFHIGAIELGRICIGICIEQELHLPPLFEIPPLEEQHRRRLFWESYVLDRHSATVLGRPLAILDDDIEVELPVNMSDHDLATLKPITLDHVPQNLENSTSPMARAFFASTKAKSSVSQNSPVQHTTDFSEVYDKLQKLLDELEEWRHNAPMFTDITAFYQAQACQLLQSLSEEITDARPYATVFELIREMTCSGWKAYKQAAVSSIDEMDALDLSMATNLPDWSYSPGYLFAGVEAYVNHFATGDFATDPMLDPVSWMRGV
ncbi:unnamed protein product [Zymoseptoria tritici ST99CH_3D1]|nr:unnamed protein product [Zymoseptoria tritici ST99CH_3D1]